MFINSLFVVFGFFGTFEAFRKDFFLKFGQDNRFLKFSVENPFQSFSFFTAQGNSNVNTLRSPFKKGTSTINIRLKSSFVFLRH